MVVASKVSSVREFETLPENSTDSQSVKNKTAQNNLLGLNGSRRRYRYRLFAPPTHLRSKPDSQVGRHKVQREGVNKVQGFENFSDKGYMVQMNFFSNFLDVY